MPSNQILELAERFSNYKNSNGEWENVFKNNEITLENGDVLSLKIAMINSKSANSGSIFINKDTYITMKFGFYDNPVADIITFDLMLQKEMLENDNSPLLYRKNVYDISVVGTPESLVCESAQTPENFNIPYVAITFDGTKYKLYEETVSFTLSSGNYTPTEIQEIITKQLQESNMNTIINNNSSALVSGGHIDANTVVLVHPDYVNKVLSENRLLPADNAYYYKYQEAGGISYRIGSSNPALIFEDGKFSFEFLHNSILLSNTGNNQPPFNEIGGSFYSLGNNLKSYTRYSGNFILSLDDDNDFWKSLGFIQDFTTTDYNLIQTTDMFINNSSRQDKQLAIPSQKVSTAQFEYYVTSQISTRIYSQNTLQFDETGYYLLECVSQFQTDVENIESKYSSISGILSKQYNNNDYITAFGGDSSVTYEHIGNPISINSIKVRVLDPKTKQVVTNLGNNSSVFLEIIKKSS